MREFLSNISLISAVFYLYIGFYIYRLNKYSNVCRTFLLLNIAMSIWSFAYSFAYTAVTPSEFYFWNKFSAFGWCTFTALILYLVLTFTENKLFKNWIIKSIVILPAPVFLFMVLFLFGPNTETSQIIKTFFYTGNFIYNFTYSILSIILLIFWRNKSKSLNQKKQANVMTISAFIAFTLNLVMETLLPMFGLLELPKMGQLYFLIMSWGVYYSIKKYQFMVIPTSIINKGLFNEIPGLTFLVDTKGVILKGNKQVYNLLNYTEKEITGKSITSILECKEMIGLLDNSEEIKETLRFNEVLIASKARDLIPFSISITPLYDSKTQAYLGLLVVGQDIRTMKELQNEIIHNKIINEKLKNGEELLSTIIESMPFSTILSSRKDNKILFANNKISELFKLKKSEMIGLETNSLYKNKLDRTALIEDINNNIPVKEIEKTFKRKDGSEFLGLITIVPAIYLEQDVVIAYISDITEKMELQQEVAKSEKMLKAFMNSITDMITVIDLEGNITFANNSALAIFEYEAGAEFSSENILAILADRDISRMKDNPIQILAKPNLPVEYKSVGKDGTITDVEVIGTVLSDDNNNAFGIIYVSRNITERKRSEEKLKQNNEEIEKMNNELLKMNSILTNRSIRDGLTNLYNHQYINELLEQEILNITNTNESLCAMMLDIDLFKNVNDTFGHQIGDKVLVVVSNLILENSRSSDLIGRYGGEEFIAILPNVKLDESYRVAERIRLSIEEYDFGIKDLKVTISIGLTQYHLEDAKSFINRADTLLYKAKANGRNRIEFK